LTKLLKQSPTSAGCAHQENRSGPRDNSDCPFSVEPKSRAARRPLDASVHLNGPECRASKMETPDTYRQRAEAAERAAQAAADKEAKRILKSAAQRWRQLADICEQILRHEKRRISD
jgi:hypothetical protein